MAYDYYEAVKDDVRDWVDSNIDMETYLNMDDGKDTLYEELNDTLWTEDGVTGNGSGSYTYDRKKAEENLSGNWDLMAEVAEEFGMPSKEQWMEPEFWDVSIRCYLLGSAISEVLDEYFE